MFFEVLSIALCGVVILLLFKGKKKIIISAQHVENLDQIILDLRNTYKKMSSDKRIPIDLCSNNDKLGANRESIIQSMGNNCEPWISRECIFVLDHILSPNSTGLEWSSGSSTIWLSYRLASLISVEHSKSWSDEVKKVITKRNLDKKTKLIWIDRDEIKYCNNEKQYIGSSNTVCYKTYVTSSLIPDIKYDFISVDGRARTGCLLRAIKMIKSKNGIILLDNAERERYRWSYKYIPSNWSRFDFWYKNGLVSMFISH